MFHIYCGASSVSAVVYLAQLLFRVHAHATFFVFHVSAYIWQPLLPFQLALSDSETLGSKRQGGSVSAKPCKQLNFCRVPVRLHRDMCMTVMLLLFRVSMQHFASVQGQ